MKRIFLIFLLCSTVCFAQTFSGVRIGSSETSTPVSDSDTFDGTELNTAWGWAPGTGGLYTVSGGSLKIQIGNGTNEGGNLTGIFKTITGASWTAEILMDFDPTLNYQSAGLWIGNGNNNCDLQRAFYTVQRVWNYDTIAGAFTAYFLYGSPATQSIRLKIQRSNQDFYKFYSADGVTYTQMNNTSSYTLPIGNSAIIGIIGGCAGTSNIATATIYSFTVAK